MTTPGSSTPPNCLSGAERRSTLRVGTRALAQLSPALQRVLARLTVLLALLHGRGGHLAITLEVGGQGPNRREPEHLHEGQAATEGLGEPGQGPDHHERVGAEVEQVRLHPDGVEREHVLPYLDDRSLGVVVRRRRDGRALGATAVGLREGVAVDLAVGGAGQRIEHHERGGHHVVGQRGAEMSAQVRAQRRGVPLRGLVGVRRPGPGIRLRLAPRCATASGAIGSRRSKRSSPAADQVSSLS